MIFKGTFNGRAPMLLAATFIFYLVVTACIASGSSPTLPYVAGVLAHAFGGLALFAGLMVLIARQPDLRRLLRPALAVLLPAVAFGVYLMWRGNTSDQRAILWAHIVTASLATAILLAIVWRRARTAGGAWVPFRAALAAACAALIALPAFGSIYARVRPPASDRIRNPMIVPTSMREEGGGPSSPFFPSSAKTNVGGIIPSNFFMDSAACGECHRDIYKQYQSSAHKFASFNNQFYRKSIEYMQDVVGTQPSKWCAGCHDHAVFFNGRFERPIKEQIDTPEAHAGLACTSCHSIVHVDGSMGNGGFTIEYPALHELASSRNPLVRSVSKFFTYLDPEPHRRSFMKPFMRQNSAEFCSACHKVHLDIPVNGYRWFRGFNDYDSWQASGVSGQGARSFYYPAKSSTCSDCHMPLVRSHDPGHRGGAVHSHQFAAANTALPLVNRDDQHLEATKAFLQSGFVSVDIFAISPVDEKAGTHMIRRRANNTPMAMTTFAPGEEAEQSTEITIRDVGQVAAPLNRAAPTVAPGRTVRVDVVVRTRRIGHMFPGGTVDAFDVWLELDVKDAAGRVVFWSGRVEDDGRGPVEPGAHFYRSYQLDAEGNPIDKRNAWQARSLLYSRLIPPGAADVAHFRLTVPKDAKGPLTMTAKLNHRKFSHYYTQFAYAGRPRPDQPPSLLSAAFNSLDYTFNPADIPRNVSGKIKGEIPTLPIVTLAQATATLAVGEGDTRWTPVVAKEDRERWNDWGIGMLLQGDLKGAQYAFEQVTRAEPAYADGWLNVARALIQEGQTEAAKPYLAQALRLDAAAGRIHYFNALVQKADGDYAGALASLRIAAEKYPRDRVVLNQMARILFLMRRFTEALDVLARVGAIDPEDVQMHYTMMLCYRAIGDTKAAAREEKLFQRFKADEASQSITARRRRISPEDNNERQLIHDHESVTLLPLTERMGTR